MKFYTTKQFDAVTFNAHLPDAASGGALMFATELPQRPGPAPTTRGPVPHGQLDQIAPTHLQEEIWGRMRSISGVYVAPTHVPYPEARAIHLAPEFGTGPDDAF